MMRGMAWRSRSKCRVNFLQGFQPSGILPLPAILEPLVFPPFSYHLSFSVFSGTDCDMARTRKCDMAQTQIWREHAKSGRSPPHKSPTTTTKSSCHHGRRPPPTSPPPLSAAALRRRSLRSPPPLSTAALHRRSPIITYKKYLDYVLTISPSLSPHLHIQSRLAQL